MWRQLWVCPGIPRRAHLSVGCEFGCRRSRASGEREILEVIKGGHECFFSVGETAHTIVEILAGHEADVGAGNSRGPG